MEETPRFVLDPEQDYYAHRLASRPRARIPAHADYPGVSGGRCSKAAVAPPLRFSRKVSADSWALPEGLDDAGSGGGAVPPIPPSRAHRPEPGWNQVHREFQRQKGVTLRLFWLAHRTVHPGGYGYRRFCNHCKLWRGRLGRGAASSVPGGREGVRRLPGPDGWRH